jgi:hypothetical protein
MILDRDGYSCAPAVTQSWLVSCSISTYRPGTAASRRSYDHRGDNGPRTAGADNGARAAHNKAIAPYPGSLGSLLGRLQRPVPRRGGRDMVTEFDCAPYIVIVRDTHGSFHSASDFNCGGLS